MNAVAEIQVQPIDSEIRLRDAVDAALRVLEGQKLELGVHALGTEVRGSIGEVLAAVEKIHEELHGRGIDRVGTTIKLETRAVNGGRVIDSSARPTGAKTVRAATDPEASGDGARRRRRSIAGDR